MPCQTGFLRNLPFYPFSREVRLEKNMILVEGFMQNAWFHPRFFLKFKWGKIQFPRFWQAKSSGKKNHNSQVLAERFDFVLIDGRELIFFNPFKKVSQPELHFFWLDFCYHLDRSFFLNLTQPVRTKPNLFFLRVTYDVVWKHHVWTFKFQALKWLEKSSAMAIT